MTTLSQYYTTRFTQLAIVMALAAVLVPNVLLPFIKSRCGDDSVFVAAANALTSRVAFVVVMAAGEVLIRKIGWKLENREFDFAGDWTGTSTYTHVHVGTGNVPFDSTHDVRIEQDALTFRLAPAPGSVYVNWNSLALELVDKDTIRYAYRVRYSARDRFPEKANGYEEMRVTKRDQKNRPVELTGEFAHCAEGQVPVYSGTVKFMRTTRSDKWTIPVGS